MERRQSQDDVPKNDSHGDICNDDDAAEYKYHESGKEEDRDEGRQ